MKVLMVCLGNICRSPMAEGIMRAAAQQSGMTIEVDSAGTSSWHVGEAPDPRAVTAMARHGIDISALRARQFTPSDFDRFDHIFVMDQDNFRDVCALARNPADALKPRLILDITGNRAGQPVPDPYFGGDAGFEKVYGLLNEACHGILKGLQEN